MRNSSEEHLPAADSDGGGDDADYGDGGCGGEAVTEQTTAAEAAGSVADRRTRDDLPLLLRCC